MNVSLIGMMGSGKSTVGKLLAERAGLVFIDVDSMIESEQNMTAAQIFRELGEEEFRKFEKEAVKRLIGKENMAVSTGGGLPLDGENMNTLKRMGPVVWLYASPGETLKRVGKAGKRPLLNVRDPGRKIESLLSSRKKYYAKADVKIDTTGKTPGEITDEILEFLKERAHGRLES